MKNTSKIKIFRYLLVISTFLVAGLVYNKLPDQIPMHWNINFEVDNWAARSGIWFLPGLLAVMSLLFEVLPRFDPRKKNYPQFGDAWEIMQTAILGFLVFIFYWQLLAIFHQGIGREITGRIFIAALGLMFMLLGNITGKIRQNYFIGIKTPWALDDPENWQKTQRVGGWTMFLAGLAFIFASALGGGYLVIFVLSISAIIAVPFSYSYWAYKKQQ